MNTLRTKPSRRVGVVLFSFFDLATVLSPAEASVSFADTTTVVASGVETRLADAPGSVRVLSRLELETTAASTLDDALRQIPGLALFRRTGSRTANPTAQGVTLRGVGASGASRAVVLDDGVPLNDPFGGWIYWSRVSPSSIETVEVARGGTSDLYGSGAVAGVIQLHRTVSAPRLQIETSWGALGTLETDAALRVRRGFWQARAQANLFQTDGYVAVPPADRGVIDRSLRSRHQNLELTVDRQSPASRVFVRGSRFHEWRGNGTALQTNRSTIAQLTSGSDWSSRVARLTWRGYASTQRFDQDSSAIGTGRATERLTARQHVPSQSWGTGTQYSRAVGTAHRFLTGVDARRVCGQSEDTLFAGVAPTTQTAHGCQTTGALFAEDLWAPRPRVTSSLALRADAWRNHRAFRRTADGDQDLADRSETALSPRFSLLVRARQPLALFGSWSRAFRAPTLNELYRPFRVGNIETSANESLRAERARELDLGIRWDLRERWLVRATVFRMHLDRTIANVTLSVRPDLIVRRRENLGSTSASGVEADLDGRWGTRWRAGVGYLFVDSRVDAFPSDPALEGRRVPQVPRHQGTLQLSFVGQTLRVGIQARAFGPQFEDDQNRLRLAGGGTMDLLASRRWKSRWETFASAENLWNARVALGRTPTLTVGPPRTLKVGLRTRID